MNQMRLSRQKQCVGDSAASGRHIASFVGFAPVEDPKICMAIVFCEPQGESYGGRVAAPVFGEVVSQGRRFLEDRTRRVRDRQRTIRVEEVE